LFLKPCNPYLKEKGNSELIFNGYKNKLPLLQQKSIESFVFRGLGFLLLFIMHFVLANTLGPSDYGVFSYTLSITFILALMAGIGWPVAMIRFINEYSQKHCWSLLSGVLIKGHQVVFCSAMVISALLAGGIMMGLVPDQSVNSFFYSAMLVPILAISQLRDRIFMGFRYVIESVFFNEIILPMALIGMVYIGIVNNADSLLKSYVWLTAITLLSGMYWLWQKLPETCKKKPEYQTKYWMKTAFPFLFAGLSQVILERTSVFILGSLGDMESAGIYSLASRIAIFNTFVMTSLNAIGAPMMSAAYYRNDIKEFRAIFFKTMKWSAIGALIPFCCMFFFPEILLGFFGEEFVSGKLVLQILAVGQFFNAATGLVGSALSMTGREQIFGKITVLTAILNLIACYLCVQVWGGVGAAIVYSLSVIFFNTVLLIIVYKIFKTGHENIIIK
jgi:O-antigen/teichoic acid export membrane protein